MVGASPPSFAASRKSRKLWTNLSPGQQKTVQKLRGALSSGSQVGLADWHVLGELAHSLSAKGQAGYGERTIDSLGELLGCTPSVVLKARKFARLYSASKAAKLEGKLSWSAIGRLMWIDDESVRTALEAECQTKKLSLRGLSVGFAAALEDSAIGATEGDRAVARRIFGKHWPTWIDC